MRRWAGLAALVLAVTTLGLLAARAGNPNALWGIVHDRCVPGARSGDPAPCVLVEPDDAVLKDLAGRTQYLLIPTARITGIEDPALLAPGAPDFFAAAWRARRYVEARAGHPLPLDAVALAINPPGARSQEQMHIHIDCLRPAIRDALRALPITGVWAMLPAALQGQRYRAMRIGGEAERNPIRLLAESLRDGDGALGEYTLVATGAELEDAGFILLAGRLGADGSGHGEDLQDHGCAIADQAEPGPLR